MKVTFQEFLDLMGVELKDAFQPFFAYEDEICIVLKDCSILEEYFPYYTVLRNAHNTYEVIGLRIPEFSKRKVSMQVLDILNMTKRMRNRIKEKYNA